ncbi:MAG: isoprenylcysteine carboxylmethyltransferase family protein [Planctomycetota bacterium]|nr:isoprenylcysteine carboxylmethyltransferase family protein [Planctomycetota bacterium]
MAGDRLARARLMRMTATRLLVGIPLLLAMLFVPAGTLDYWQAWAYLAIIVVSMTFALRFLFRNSPELLERRMRMKETEPRQKWVVRIGAPCFVATYLLCGFDRRFAWSSVAAEQVLLADLVVVLSYIFIFQAFKENRYASRIVEVVPGQKVIGSGPYAIVRHPMYLGVSLMCMFSPLALGSVLAMLPALLMVPLLVVRILNEEDVLMRELEGYRDYMKKTRCRLVPGIW